MLDRGPPGVNPLIFAEGSRFLMGERIHVLPDEVVNRIAAGEVVERPASVAKELLENAVDAQGTAITILVEGGGIQGIRVIDNGTGMGREDALTAFRRHATSKITSSDDLATVQTLGFRGEALPSIASVSRVNIVTKEEQSLVGTEILLESGHVRGIRETGCPRGTDISVRDLFFNTPARRKFLRSVSTEFSHIVEAVVRIGLAHPGIHLRLFHNEKRVLDVPSTGERMIRIGGLLGGEVYKALRRVETTIDCLSVEGYLSDPTTSRPNGKGIYIYVNGRFVKDRMILHAIMEGYRHLIPKDRYPVALLFLTVPPWSVDVNVHPAKSEVRFGFTDSIYRVVVGLCRDMARERTTVRQDAPSEARAGVTPLVIKEPSPVYRSVRPGVTEPGPSEVSTGELFGKVSASLHVLGQIGRTYLVCETQRGLLLIDQHAAHERIVFERLKQGVEKNAPAVQRLLLPETVELSPAEWETFEGYRPELSRLGFDLEPFGRNTLAIRSVPSIFSGQECPQIVSDVIRDLMAEEARGGVQRGVETALRVTACHGAIRAGQVLSKAEMAALLGEMEEEGFPTTCPHGRPICVEIGVTELEKMFKRSS